MILTAPSTVDWDITGLPLAIQTWLTAFNLTLKTGWLAGTWTREFTIPWTDLGAGGYTQAKENALLQIVGAYRRVVFSVVVGKKSNQTNVFLTFEIP